MPNHVTHRVIVTGPAGDVARFRDEMFAPDADSDGQPSFDFNQLIPMPESIREADVSSLTSYAMWALGNEPAPFLVMDGACDPTSFPWAAEKGLHTRKDVQAWLQKDHPHAIPQAKKAMENKRLYGHHSWYDWSVANWGTKWNSYQLEIASDSPGRLEFTFDTAWSPPEPVLDLLPKRFPTLRFEVGCFDEGHNFSGYGFYSANPEDQGLVIEDLACSDHYLFVHGEPMAADEDEEA